MKLFVADIPKRLLLCRTVVVQERDGACLDVAEVVHRGRLTGPPLWPDRNRVSIPDFLSLIASPPSQFRSRMEQILVGGDQEREKFVNLYDQRALVLRKPIESSSKVIIVGERGAISRSQEGTRGALVTGFLKFASSLADPGSKIHLPKSESNFDADGVLGVVIGKRAERVSKDESLSCIAGFTLLVDVTDRKVYEVECKTNNNLMAKNGASLSPLGPCIKMVTSDELGQEIEVTLRLNGKVCQHFTLGDLVYGVKEMISYWSRLILEPGDILGLGATIARSGSGDKLESPVSIKPGDLLELESTGVGLLKAEIV